MPLVSVFAFVAAGDDPSLLPCRFILSFAEREREREREEKPSLKLISSKTLAIFCFVFAQSDHTYVPPQRQVLTLFSSAVQDHRFCLLFRFDFHRISFIFEGFFSDFIHLLACDLIVDLKFSVLKHQYRTLGGWGIRRTGYLPVVPVEKPFWNFLSVSHSFSSFQDWGRAGDVAALGVCWHVPSQEEENFVFQLLSRLLHPELQRIKGHVSGEQPMSRCAVVCVFFMSWFFRDFSFDVIGQARKQNKRLTGELDQPAGDKWAPKFDIWF